MTNKVIPASYILTCSPRAYLLELRVRDILDSIIDDRHLVIAAAGISARTVSMLNNLADETNRLDLFISEEQQDSTKVLEQALQKEVALYPAGLTVIIDGRIELSEQPQTILTEFESSPECGLAVVSHNSIEKPSPCSFVLDLMQNPFYPLLTILRNDLLQSRATILNEDLHFFALPELLLRLSSQTPIKILPPTCLQKIPINSRITKNEQRIMDEENNVLEKYQKLFFERKFKQLSTKELAKTYQFHIKQVMELFKKIQEGILESSVEDYDRHIFRYCLLALFSGETENARQMMETSFNVVSERPALMRLYKLITLYFPLHNHSVSGPEKVSVIIALFNQGHYLEEAVTSVLRQTWTNWEIIIVNDGSTDNSYEIAKELVKRLNDSRIKLITQENKGMAGSRISGLKESDGEFVVALDSDDMIAPEYFAIAINLINNNSKAAWITPKTLVFGNNNHIVWGEEYSPINAIIGCPAPCSSLIRRKVLDQVGYFRTDLTNREDSELWLRLLEGGWTSITTEKPLFIYRHACQRAGTKTTPNLASKEEITSLHPWWFRRDLNLEMREKAFTTFSTQRFPDWFLNWENINKLISLFNDREKFIAAMEELKAAYPPITKPSRWNSDDDDCYLDIREVFFGVGSQTKEN